MCYVAALREYKINQICVILTILVFFLHQYNIYKLCYNDEKNLDDVLCGCVAHKRPISWAISLCTAQEIDSSKLWPFCLFQQHHQKISMKEESIKNFPSHLMGLYQIFDIQLNQYLTQKN